MRSVACIGLWIVISGICFLTTDQFYSAAAISVSSQPCPDKIELIVTKESGRPTNSWRGLIPLKSTRLEVEALVGKASWSGGSTFIYEMPCGRLNVVYSEGSCEVTEVERWNVPDDVLIRMEFAPRSTVLVKDLNLPANRYPRQQQLHPENWVKYRNKEDGIVINALLNKKGDTVAVITYEPTTKQEELFLCQVQ